MAFFIRGKFLGFDTRKGTIKNGPKQGQPYEILEAGIAVERVDRFNNTVVTTQYLNVAKAIKENVAVKAKWDAAVGKNVNAPVIDSITIYNRKDGSPAYDQKWTIFGEPEVLKG